MLNIDAKRVCMTGSI